ncbi:MAG: hypothetical protein H6994_02760 [Pseudomonadales bacterium]|nr:hypothetical protein [Pseudomonadales bacterium]
MAPEKRQQLLQAPMERTLRVNELLVEKIPKHMFLNLIDTLCHGDKCPVFADARTLIAYDGEHLSQSGARYVANALTGEPASELLSLGEPK